MTAYKLRLVHDLIGPGKSVTYAGGINRILYCRHGGAIVSGHSSELVCDGAAHANRPVTVTGSLDGATIWRFELVTSDSDVPAECEGAIRTALQVEADVPLESPHGYLIRCDAVNLPLGCEIYEHTHAGPGIRCMHRGSLTLEIEGRRRTFTKDNAWFENGADHVSGKGSTEKMAGFVRAMILPKTYLGKSSISYVREQDWAKPKKQTYKTYVDQVLEL